MKVALAASCTLLGFGFAVAGIALISPPAAFIVGGTALAIFGLMVVGT